MTRQRFENALKFVNRMSIGTFGSKERSTEETRLKIEFNKAKLYFWQEKAFMSATSVENLSISVGIDAPERDDPAIIEEMLASGVGEIHLLDFNLDILTPGQEKYKCVGFYRIHSYIGAITVEETFTWDKEYKGETMAVLHNMFDKGQPHTEDESKAVGMFTAYALGLRRFAETPYVHPTKSRVSSVSRKSGKRTEREFNVIVLRRPKPEPLPEPRKKPDHIHGHITCEFDVNGYWRNQWFPSEKTNRKIWINGFVKGKGLPRKPTIHKVVDRG